MRKKIKTLINKMGKAIEKYYKFNILFLSYVLFSVIIGLILRAFTVGNVLNVKALYIDLVFSVFIGSFAYLFKPKNRFAYYMILLTFNSILAVINHIYYTWYLSFVSVNMISTLTMLGDVSDSVTTKLQLVYFIYLIVPILFVLVQMMLKKNKYYLNKFIIKKNLFVYTFLSALILAVLASATITKLEYSRLIKQWNREYIVEKLGIYLYTANDLVQSIEPKVNTLFGYDESSRNFRTFYENKEEPKSNKYTGIFEGKNVIFIHMESIQNFLIGLKVNGIEITPNINKLTKNSMYFSSFYPQISIGTSSDTEFTLLTSLLPSTSGTVFVNYYNRTYESMPSKFKELGYYTFSMHANNADYWNRKTMHKNLGYDTFYAKDSYDINEETDIIGLGLNDKSFLLQSVDKIKEINSTHENYFGTIITLSNHTPFNDVEKYGDLDFTVTYTRLGENGEEQEISDDYLENSQIGNYLKSAHYADEALGLFFDKIKEEGLDKDTIFILYGDHEAKLGKNQLNLLYNYDVSTGELKSDDDPTYVDIDAYKYDLLKNTPLIIYGVPKKYQVEYMEVMGMYDVFPTVANMFNFKTKYSLGNDYFSDNEKIVIFPNGNFLTNSVYYNSTKDEYVSLTSKPIDGEYIEKFKNYSLERLDISKSIIIHDLIKNDKNGGKND